MHQQINDYYSQSLKSKISRNNKKKENSKKNHFFKTDRLSDMFTNLVRIIDNYRNDISDLHCTFINQGIMSNTTIK